MILEVDAGNTRLKWRLMDGDRPLGRGALLKDEIDTLAQNLEDIGRPTLIRLASVADPVITQRMSDLAGSWGAGLNIAEVSSQAAGVTCGYVEPNKLGVDRWLAMVAAFNQQGRACVVVDAGSAVTVDLVDSAGGHLGGYIVPGFELMRSALFGGTSQVQVKPQWASSMTLGSTTEQAVHHGALLMIVGLVLAAADNFAQVGVAPEIIVTGGDAERVVTALEVHCRHCPELVLDGLALVAP